MENEFQITSKCFPIYLFETSNSHSSNMKKSFYELIELLKVSKFEIFQNGIQIIFKPLFISLNGTGHILYTLGFCDEMNLNSWISKCKMKVLGKSFYSLSFNFQKVSISNHFHTINHTTIKQTIIIIYLI